MSSHADKVRSNAQSRIEELKKQIEEQEKNVSDFDNEDYARGYDAGYAAGFAQATPKEKSSLVKSVRYKIIKNDDETDDSFYARALESIAVAIKQVGQMKSGDVQETLVNQKLVTTKPKSQVWKSWVEKIDGFSKIEKSGDDKQPVFKYVK